MISKWYAVYNEVVGDIIHLSSNRYTRKELSLRTSILYCGNLISNAFGNLIAAGVLDNMQGKLGHAAWRWFVPFFYLSSFR